jgi:hypothetical protein
MPARSRRLGLPALPGGHAPMIVSSIRMLRNPPIGGYAAAGRANKPLIGGVLVPGTAPGEARPVLRTVPNRDFCQDIWQSNNERCNSMSASTADGLVGSTSSGQPAVRRRRGLAGFLLIDSPYILMLLAALGGISYRSFYGQPILAYWKILLVVFAALSIWAGLARARTSSQIYGLVWTQVLHWVAFYAALSVLATTSVRAELDDNAISDLILTTLALAVFLAGVHGRAWRLCVVGLVLGATIPTVTWIQTSSTLIGFLGVVFVVVVLAFFLLRGRTTIRGVA